MKVEELTSMEKYKVWIDYMVTQIYLNIIGEFERYITNRNKHHIKSFEEFCSGTDSRESSCLLGWFWRFENRIF